jgi:NTE family protein
LRNWLASTGYPETRPDTYFIRVGFDGIPEPARRDRFNGIATDFTLPAEDVDALRAVAGELLDSSLDFRRLVDELRGPAVATRSGARMGEAL